MDDDKIIELYFKRDENAIHQTQIKYGKYCYTIAKNILGDHLDAEECVNDTYLEIWETIPPNRPEIFSAYLAMIARRRALDRYRYNNAQKREGSKATVSLEELVGCISDVTRLDDELEDDELASYCTVVTVLDEAQIINVATDISLRGRGYAKAVLEAVFEECKKRGISFISLEVRESNLPAISLYQSLGFTTEGKRKDFYKNPRENALVMIKNLD